MFEPEAIDFEHYDWTDPLNTVAEQLRNALSSEAAMNPSDIDPDRETLEFDLPETIEPEELLEQEAVNIEFDEADALFAKRTGIKDSHGRY